jgi:microcystin-dependent protein
MTSIQQIKGSDGTGNANVATVQSTRAPAATTIVVDTVLGINPTGFAASMGTPHTFTDPITSETITVISEATCVDFTGHVDGANLVIDTIAPGYTDAGSAVSDIVIIRPTTQYADNIADVLEVAHEDDGKLQPDAPINSPQLTLANVTPVGSVLDYAGATAPSGWLLCYGQSLVRATYADLFTAIGTIYGSADGTHFNVPDLRGRVAAGQDDMGGSSANRLTNPGSTIGGIDGDVLGGTGGAETHVITTAQLASHLHTYSQERGGVGYAGGANKAVDSSLGATGTSTGLAGSDAAHNNVQPTIILNKIIKY